MQMRGANQVQMVHYVMGAVSTAVKQSECVAVININMRMLWGILWAVRLTLVLALLSTALRKNLPVESYEVPAQIDFLFLPARKKAYHRRIRLTSCAGESFLNCDKSSIRS